VRLLAQRQVRPAPFEADAASRLHAFRATLPAMPQPKPGEAARKVVMARADKRAAGLRPTIEALQASGVTSLQGMAAALNEAGIPTPRGKRQWHPVQVRRLLARL
jgi:hypothetical protein